MASHNILADEHILQLLGDGTNSELSDLSDEDDEYFQSTEFDYLLNNFDDEDFNLLLDEDVNDKETEIVVSYIIRVDYYIFTGGKVYCLHIVASEH